MLSVSFFIQRKRYKNEFERTNQTISDGIRDVDIDAKNVAAEYNASLLKIPMSLGRVEEIALQLASITGKTKNDMKKKCIIMMSADNGITAKGVSSAPKEVTVSMTECFSKYVTGVVGVFRVSGSDLIVYDIGVDGDIHDPNVINKKIRRGTADFSEGPAMSYEEALQAIMVGIEAVKDAVDQGYQGSEPGNGHRKYFQFDCSDLCIDWNHAVSAVGRGAGLTDEAYQSKSIYWNVQ